jgi:N-acetylmuramoyl-L-alanine amidase
MRCRSVVPLALALAGVCLVRTAPAAPLYSGLPLTDVMSAYGFTDRSAYGGTLLFRGRYATFTLENGSRKFVYNGVTFYLNDAVDRAAGDWIIRPVDAVDVIGALVRPDAVLAGVPLGMVVIDPGHGGVDPGARTPRQVEEKHLTLDLALRVRIRLQACGVESRLTRDRDVALTLDDRCELATRAGAALFVSIHLNASRDPAISGVETFIVPAAGFPPTAEAGAVRQTARPVVCPGNRHDQANLLLAHYVHRGLLAQTGAGDRGIRRARFFVIRNAQCPAALVECGFLSNPQEAGRLSSEPYRATVADGLTRGILTYLVRARQARLPPAPYQ